MTTLEIIKPSLNQTYLQHFGIKGMKWGVRHKRPDEEQRKSLFGSRKRKFAASTVVVVAGAAAAAFILAGQGKSVVPSLDDVSSLRVPTRIRKAGNATAKAVSNTPSNNAVPSPFLLRAQAGQIAHNQAMARIGAQKLTDQTWRDSAKMKQLIRSANEATSKSSVANSQHLSIAEIRKRLEDPAYVWEL